MKSLIVVGLTLTFIGASRWHTLPMWWGIGIDVSGSFAPELSRAKGVVTSTLRQCVKPGDHLIFCAFAQSPRLLVNTTVDPQTFAEAERLVERLQPSGEAGTDIIAAITLMAQHLQGNHGVILIATDGFQDPPSANALVTKGNYRVIFIGWRNARDTALTSALLRAQVPFVITNDGDEVLKAVTRRHRVWSPNWWLVLSGLLFCFAALTPSAPRKWLTASSLSPLTAFGGLSLGGSVKFSRSGRPSTTQFSFPRKLPFVGPVELRGRVFGCRGAINGSTFRHGASSQAKLTVRTSSSPLNSSEGANLFRRECLKGGRRNDDGCRRRHACEVCLLVEREVSAAFWWGDSTHLCIRRYRRGKSRRRCAAERR